MSCGACHMSAVTGTEFLYLMQSLFGCVVSSAILSIFCVSAEGDVFTWGRGDNGKLASNGREFLSLYSLV